MWSVFPALAFSSQVSAFPVPLLFFQKIYVSLLCISDDACSWKEERMLRKNVCFQTEREVADWSFCVGSSGAFGGTFARFVLDEAVGSCCHQYN